MKQASATLIRWLSNVLQSLQAGNSTLRRALRGLVMALLVWAAWSVTAILYTLPTNVEALLGEPAPRAVKAPRTITYVSDVKTQEARTAAARAVEDIYTGPSRDIAREQVALLNDQLRSVSRIRADAQLSTNEKIDALLQAVDLHGSDPSILLTLGDEAWRSVMLEALRVLELIMRDEIRPSQIAEARRRAQRLIPNTLSDEEHDLVVALVQDQIVPNSSHDAETTLARRHEARNAVAPAYLTIREGEAVLREGELVTPLALEKLQALELYPAGIQWYDAVSDALLSLLLVACVALYILRTNPLFLYRPRRAWLFTLVLITMGIGARLMVPGRTVVPYLFPAAAASMVVALLLDVPMALLVAVVSAVLVGLSAGNSLELGVYALAGSLVGATMLWHLDQLGRFVRATVYLAFANIAIVLSFRLGTHTYDAVGLLQLVMAGAANAIFSTSLAFVAYTFIGRAFGIATSLQLLELARPNHPLFRQLLINAPGTYHHSIVVSNMAERAAEATGADPLLARVGSYYHDIGKSIRPYFFAENQADGSNPHDNLDPKASAAIIIGHATEGLDIARRYKVPERVCAFIPEHHGTTMVTYFFRQATQENDDVHEEDFRYPGPKPQSKESAIVMLADGIEAWVRANRPGTTAEMERVARQVINDRLISGQLDECDLTLSDLGKIREAFITVLQGIFHPRIRYPERSTRTARPNNHEPNSST